MRDPVCTVSKPGLSLRNRGLFGVRQSFKLVWLTVSCGIEDWLDADILFHFISCWENRCYGLLCLFCFPLSLCRFCLLAQAFLPPQKCCGSYCSDSGMQSRWTCFHRVFEVSLLKCHEIYFGDSGMQSLWTRFLGISDLPSVLSWKLFWWCKHAESLIQLVSDSWGFPAEVSWERSY